MEQSKYQHSDKLPLSLIVEELEKEKELTEKALHILSVEDRDNTYRPDGAVSALINHWLCERDLNCYINGKLVEDFTALTVLSIDGDYDKGEDALENWITVRKDELAVLLKQRNLTVPAFLRPSVQISKAPPPITPVRGGGYGAKRAVEVQRKPATSPDWAYWPADRHVKPWQAVALSLNLEPESLKHSSSSWMGGPGAKPILESESFPDAEIEATFRKRLALLGDFVSHSSRVQLGVLAGKLVAHTMPPEMAALIDVPATTGKSTEAPAEPVAKTGRPPEIARKAEILHQIIQSMIKGKELDPSNLPGGAADLLDACQRIENSKVGKKQIFNKSAGAFREWLKTAGYGFKDGRAPSNEAKYWTHLCVETMSNIDAGIFTGVVPEKPR